MGWDVQKSNLSTCSASYIPLHIIVPRILRNETEKGKLRLIEAAILTQGHTTL